MPHMVRPGLQRPCHLQSDTSEATCHPPPAAPEQTSDAAGNKCASSRTLGLPGTWAHKALNTPRRGQNPAEEPTSAREGSQTPRPPVSEVITSAAAKDGTNQFIRKSTGSSQKRFINKTIRCTAPRAPLGPWLWAASRRSLSQPGGRGRWPWTQHDAAPRRPGLQHHPPPLSL